MPRSSSAGEVNANYCATDVCKYSNVQFKCGACVLIYLFEQGGEAEKFVNFQIQVSLIELPTN